MVWCAKQLAFASYSVYFLIFLILSTKYTEAKEDLGHRISLGLNECSLSPLKLARIYDEATNVWTITDQLLRELGNDLQTIIDCTKEDDILHFKTTHTITPKATMTIPWNLTIAADPKLSTTNTRDEDSKEKHPPISFTCPKVGGVIISQSRWLAISNVQFIECSNSGTIISIEPDCRGAEEDGQIHIHNVEFKDNSLYSNQGILDVRYPYCSSLSMHNVLIHNNTCDATDCFALPLKSTLTYINVTQNAGHESCLTSQAVFSLPIQSHASVTGVKASRNKIRIFGMEAYATLRLVQSDFHGNNPVLSPIYDEAMGGGVLYVKDSKVSIEGCTFASNTAPNGGVLFSIHSQVNISECSFVGNLAKDGEGGALFINSSTLNVSQSSFESNEAAKDGAVLFAELSTTAIQLTNVTRSHSEFSGTVFLRNCTAHLDGVIFQENQVQWFGGALDASGSEVIVKATKFMNNSGSSGSAVSLRYQTNASISGSLFSGNNARDFGALHTNEGSKVEIQECRFERNIADSGGAIYLITGASVKIHKSFVFTSTARYAGGGVVARLGATFIASITYFADNKAKDGNGGGILSESSEVFMHYTLFDSNTAKSGGGVHITNASVKLFSCNFTDQDASKNGGGLYFARSDVHFRDFFVIYNRAVLDGGGIYATSETRLKGKDSRFYFNFAGRRGGGLALMAGSVFKCRSCDIVDNKAKIGPDIYKKPHQVII